MKVLLLATIFISSSIATEDSSNKGAKYSNVVRKCLQDGQERSLSSYKDLQPSELYVRLAIEMILESLRLQEMQNQGVTVKAEKALNAGQNMFAKVIKFTTSKENEDLTSQNDQSETNQITPYNKSMNLIEEIESATDITINYQGVLAKEIEKYVLNPINNNSQQVVENCFRLWAKTNNEENRDAFLNSFVEKYEEEFKIRENTTPRPIRVSEEIIRTYGKMLIDMIHAMKCFKNNGPTNDFEGKCIRFLLITKILSKVTRDEVTIKNCAAHSLRGLLSIDPKEQRSNRDEWNPFWEILLQNVDGVITNKIISFSLDNGHVISLPSLLKEIE